MRAIRTTAYAVALRHLGIRERAGEKHHPLIQWWLSLCDLGMDAPDEIPWCGCFVSGIAWLLDLPRSKSAAARSWLNVGQAITLADAEPGNDIVILKRGTGNQPGPEVIKAPGHVGFFAGASPDGRVLVLGGNQSDAVTIAAFDRASVIGTRRLV